MKKPKHVPDSLVQQIEDHATQSWPRVVDPALLEQSNSRAGDFVPFPSELIAAHVQRRRRIGVSEAQLDEEIQFLMQVFERATKKLRR